MKTKLLISVLVWILITAFYFYESGNKQSINQTPNTSPASKPFLIGSVANGPYKDTSAFTKANMNLWHTYTAYTGNGTPGVKRYPVGWTFLGVSGDTLTAPIENYYDGIHQILSNNAQHGMYSYMMRPKIEYACYGQRSDYQCDSIQRPSNPANDTTNWFYSYDSNKTGVNVIDGQETPVRFCEVSNAGHNAGYVVKNLRTNREQCNTFAGNMGQDAIFDWYIMPKIKIPVGTSNNARVCRIEVINWEGDTVNTFELTGLSFKDGNNQYYGEYIEKFKQTLNGNREPLIIPVGETIHFNPLNKNWTATGDNDCQFDIRVYWYKECNMWIDYVRVENDIAYNLLTDTTSVEHNKLVNGIKDETNYFTKDPELKPHKFYIEEVEYNTLQNIRKVNEIIQGENPDMSVICVPYLCAPAMNAEWVEFNKTKVKSVYRYAGLKEFYMSYYPLHGEGYSVGHGYHSYIPNTFDTCDYNMTKGKLGVSKPVETYEANLQDLLDNHGLFIDNGLETALEISKELEIPFIFLEQAHLFLNPSTIGHEQYSQREPTNQELEAMGCIGISYGAKGLSYFSYDSFGNFDPDTSQIYQYGRGLMENRSWESPPDTAKRYRNVYGQEKWNKVVELNKKYKNWGPYLMNFDINYTKSCSYSVEDERYPFLTSSYFSSIITYKPGSGYPACVNQNPEGSLPAGLTYDCINDRYLQVATFQTSASDINKYFMIVNRRCSPFINESSVDNRGGKRNICVKFDINSSDFAAHNNWDIIDLDSNITVAKVDMGSGALIDLGWYNPGQGKLYKISPTVLNGGTLVGDETISGNVNCNGMIYSNGHNITISPNATVTFSDSAGIEMNGGCFVSGVNSDNAEAVTLTGKTSSTFWKGITLIGCDSIGVYNTNVSNIKANDTAKAFSIINSYKVNFRSNTITASNNSGGIQAVYNCFSDNPIVFNVRDCNFYMNNSGYSAISIFSNASVTLPLITEWCTFNSSNDTSNAIMLSEVTGGAIKNNSFYNFGKSVVLLYSAIDLYGNIILGRENSQGIQCLSSSEVSLSPSSGQYLGGYNYIKNYGSSSSNIYSNSSTFNIDAGQNDFDLNDIDNSKHLTGDLSGMPYSYVNATKNCFHKDSITNIDATHSAVWYDNSLINFIFTDYSCELTPPGDYFVYQYSGYNDTIYYRSGGEGGGFNPNKIINIEVNAYKSLKDTININLRKRNYLTVEDKAKQILTQFPDSLESSGMVQKLYMASLSLDSTKIGITKTFLENLIVNNSQNPSLVKRAFYFIQKCKVKLGQYQSALDGFQYIMTQNPYTYEGLVASWDYAATYLLMGSGGSNAGNFEQITEELNTPADTLLSRMTKRDINTNKGQNTTSIEQITKTFYEKIKNVTKDDKSIQEAKIKTLEKKIETTKNKTEKNDAKRELATMKQIDEVVKVKKPNTVMTHVAILNNDIKKVFGIGKGSKDESKINLIPTTYTLYQNYPNPFNPVTKIAYDIPRDAKVKLVIYDILGREIKTLVNNEFKTAGKYITEFNGSYLSSGVYFARILVNEGKDFMAVKKLVLLK